MEKRETPKVNARVFVIFVIGIILISVTGALIFRGGSEWASIYNIIGLVFLIVIVPAIVKKKKWSVQKKIPDSRKGYMETQKEVKEIKREQFGIRRRPGKEMGELSMAWKIMFLIGIFLIVFTFLINHFQMTDEGYAIFIELDYVFYIMGGVALFGALIFWLAYDHKKTEYERHHPVFRS
jgi:hypothetical protein